MALTDKQKLFVHEYLVDLNATQAAIRAGYSEETSGSIGHENLKKPEIRDAIQLKMDERSRSVEITAEMVLETIYKIANVDIGDAYDEKGNLLPIKDIPEDVRKCISSIKVFEEFVGFGKDRIHTGDVREVRFWDKTKSLELLGRHLKLFTDKVQHSGDKENPITVQKVSQEEVTSLIGIARGNTEKN